MSIKCPKCQTALVKKDKPSTKLSKQQKLLPQYNWGTYVCTKCSYSTVRIIR